MAFKNRKVRPYNPKQNPPGVNPQGVPLDKPTQVQAFEFSDFSEGTKLALKEILDRKAVNDHESQG